jgi:hypothetical protein
MTQDPSDHIIADPPLVIDLPERIEPEEEPLECLDDYGEGTCEGNVEYRMPLSGTGKSFPRCDGHWDKRLDAQEGINQRYPTHPPSDWSPWDAGEHWDEDEY